jgi:hypothetical protein
LATTSTPDGRYTGEIADRQYSPYSLEPNSPKERGLT